MACNCFETVNNQLREKLEDPCGSLNAMLCLENNTMVTKPCVEFVYTKKNKNGSRQKRDSTINVAYGFCPFCGKKYNEETKEEKEEL